MVEQQKPWTWTDDRTVVLRTTDKGELVFRLLPVEVLKVRRFHNELVQADSVRSTLAKGLQAFQTGQAEYSNAVRRLKKIHLEIGKALAEQLEVANGVGLFFEPAGLAKEFDDDVPALTDFSAEAIQHLYDLARKGPEKKSPEAPPRVASEPPGLAVAPPAEEEPVVVEAEAEEVREPAATE